MNIAIALSSSVLFIGILIAFLGWMLEEADLIAAGVIVAIMGSIVGFGIICSVSPSGEDLITFDKPHEIAKSETMLFVKYNEATISSKEHAFFIANEQDIMVKIIQLRNAWGINVNNPSYSLVLSNERLERNE